MPKTTNIKSKQVVYDGETFTRDKKTGYYLSARPINKGKRVQLHRWVYIKTHGEIPKGYSIHHIDENKENNSPENLMALPSGRHASMHVRERIAEDPDEYARKFVERTNDKAKAWHKSEAGCEWHKEHAKVSIVKSHIKDTEFTCVVCGKTYLANHSQAGRTKFCSRKCKAKYRRDMHLDHIEKTCPICGKKFTTNKYDEAETCGHKCGGKLHSMRKRECVY